MSASDPNLSVLHRKTVAGQQQHQARSVTVAKAMRLSVAKVALDVFDMAMQAIGLVVEERSQEDCVEMMADDALLVLLDGPQGRVGAAMIDAGLVGGLIQQQTMGRVTPEPGSARPMTDTDAAMCAPMLDALFAKAAQAVEDEGDKLLLRGFTFGARADEPRLVAMALEERDYRVIRLTLDMAKGARQGDLVLFVPSVPVPDPDGDGLDEAEHTGAADSGPRNLTDVVMHLEAELMVQLCHVRMNLSDLTRLSAGDTLLLPPGTFPKTRIIAQSGKCLGTGTLGQVDGQRALKIDREPSHAKQPQRRESDQPDVEMPQVAPIDMGLSGDPDSPASIPPELPMAALPDFDDLQLPELDDLPDLNSLPDLDKLPDLAALPDLKSA
ncbi:MULTISPECIES: FliM/FliN family flagellar motor switch protein [Roseobacteraceae]|jgi:flagellar motor switch/type III secretory pathway protein FliN|uniref:Flagellar motor switch protein FliM n=1 Tax=Pseudosulfitobacter pseudonitzschiae TaxID=1402135 RepID=A0A221JYU1_9RHOB|nr:MULTISPECIES: FliM/FliN family flagellar motor C-terminal domain-containing protein [Roseobacteraceae]ASM71800.1 flagellar motor switch protein FliM [Pseudosulfitobacter pseudonitzschiae]